LQVVSGSRAALAGLPAFCGRSSALLGGALVGFGGRRAGSDDRLRSVLVDELEEGQDGMARSTLGVEPARAVAEGRARHVRVDPGAAFGELPQEQGCADRAAVTLSGVLKIGDVAL